MKNRKKFHAWKDSGAQCNGLRQGIWQATDVWRAAFLHGGLSVALLATGISRAQVMVPLDDAQMESVNARGALFVMDKILGDTASPSTYDDFNYYRVSLDAELSMNMNIDRLRLGCGGSNDLLASGSTNGSLCDIDGNYLRFMGRNGSSSPGSPVTSDFILNRPYIEFAIKNDGTRGQRDVVGVKIGFKSADGLLSIGREYADGQVNLESGGTCDTALSLANTNRVNCHSGLDTLSGYANLQLSGNGRVSTSILLLFTGNADICFGNTTTNTTDPCGAADTLYRSLWGTRMTKANLANTPLKVYNKGGTIGGLIPNNGNLDLQEDLAFIHNIFLDKLLTKDFFLSFQREPVDYPIFDQGSPYDTDGVSGPRTSSRFSQTANTGWWMNIPYAELLDINTGLLCIPAGDAIGFLLALSEGVNLSGLPLGQVPARNCYGAATFC